jgi:hypothetical protein
MADPSIPQRHLLSNINVLGRICKYEYTVQKCKIGINVLKFEDRQMMSSLHVGIHCEPILEVPHSSSSYIAKFDAVYTLVERVPTCKDEILCSF